MIGVGSELEAIKSLFNEKEKELSVAVSRVEDLSHQLESLRQGRINGLQHGEANNNHPALQELNRLRKEVVVSIQIWSVVGTLFINISNIYCFGIELLI